jgi:hypothetical protein
VECLEIRNSREISATALRYWYVGVSCSASEMHKDQEQQGDQCYSSQVLVERGSSCPAGGMLRDQEQQGDQCYSSQIDSCW